LHILFEINEAKILLHLISKPLKRTRKSLNETKIFSGIG
jgi:hypothetical protein